MIRRILRKYGDGIFALVMCTLLVLNAGLLLWQRRDVTSGWETDFSQRAVPLEEIVSGGVSRDQIRPIDTPRFEPVDQAATWLDEAAPVLVVEIGAAVRAYPLAVLLRHEIVNDVLAGQPIAVTYCPLCNSALVFDRRVAGEVLRFGVSGNLRNSDLIMWDDRTQSWWQQVTGTAIVGAYTGTMLDMVPAQVVGFAAFARRFPQGEVLTGDAAYPDMTYARTPYSGYDTDASPALFQGEPDDRLFPTAHVLAGVINRQPMAYSFATLAQQRVLNHEIDGLPVVVFWQPGALSVLDVRELDRARDVGMAAAFERTLEGRMLTFTDDAGTIRDVETGSAWNIFGEAVTGELQGSALRRLDAQPYLWFAWAAFYPETRIYGE